MKKLLFILLCILAGVQTTKAQEAYACYTSDNTTLTFYYDNQRSTRGTTYDLNTSDSGVGWYSDGISANVTQVVFNSSFANARPTSTYQWFNGMSKLQSIVGLSYLNTIAVTNMNFMFTDCILLTSLDLSHFNTSNVDNMSWMFYHCANLKTIYVGDGWSTAAVAYSYNMFANCTKLVGGQGTAYDEDHITVEYAHIDGGPSTPGYLTDINALEEAYACYTPSNTTLTFYYDNQRSSRTGTTYDLNTDYAPDWRLDGTYANVTKVVFNSSFANARPTTTYLWFFMMENLQSITGITYLNTSEVTDMTYMFSDCKKLTSLDVSHFNTSKVTTMLGMFNACSSLTSLDVSHFNTSNVTGMSWMFHNCEKLTSLDVSSFNTAKVNNMNYMFGNCSLLTTICAGDGWSTAAVTSSDAMFYYCTKLVGGLGTTFDANHVDASYAHIDGGPSNPGYFTAEGAEPWVEPEAYARYTPSNTTLTFYYDNQRSTRTGTTYDLPTGTALPDWYSDGTYTSVTRLVINSSFANARPTTTSYWFCNLTYLESITGMEYLNTNEVTNMSGMFAACYRLLSLDVSHFNTAKVTNMGQMFYGCASLTSLDVSNFNTASVTDMECMFESCYSLPSLDLSSFNTAMVTNMYGMFKECYDLQTIYVGNGWSTAAVTSADEMFLECYELVGGQGTTYDENHIDASYAHIDGGPSNPGYLTDINALKAYACYTSDNTTLTFYYDNQRSSRTGKTYDLNTGENVSGWITDRSNANVTKVLFNSSFASARPTTTYGWFYVMKNLQSIIGMENLNTSEVTNMAYMFNDCESLASLDVSHFNTAKVTDMTEMFSECTGLTSLDLSSFNTSSVTNMSWMFGSDIYLRTIFVGSGWSSAAVSSSDNMFYYCTSLVGGQGTTYDSGHKDAAYAHIDGGPSNPGYFTDINAPVAYACYTESNTTLTFYYDTQRSTRTGTTYDLPTGNRSCGWYKDGTYANVTNAVFNSSFADARPTTTLGWFYEMSKLQSITGMKYLNTSEVTDMSWMFGYCSVLTSLDLSSFNTANVTEMAYMFYGCYYLKTIYVSDGWSTTAVTYSDEMFGTCGSLVGGQGTAYDYNHEDATYAHIDGGASNPGYLTDPNAPEAYACYTESNTTLTFYYDTQRSSRTGTTYDMNRDDNRLPAWWSDDIKANATKAVFDPSFASFRPTTTFGWFYEMEYLQSVSGMAYLNTSEVTRMDVMFFKCSRLPSLDLSRFNTANVTSMESMFHCCYSLTSLDLSSFNTKKVTDMFYMFAASYNLETIYVGSDWSTAAVTDSRSMFFNCSSLVGGQGTTYDENHTDAAYAHVDGGSSNPGYFTKGYNYDFEVDGIYYKFLGSNLVAVTYKDDTYGCYSGEVVIPEAVEYDGWWYLVSCIGERAFYQCPYLTKVTIPGSVDRIENEAFGDAFMDQNNSSVTCLALTPPSVSPYSFDNVYSNYLTLYVPYGCKSAYEAIAAWNKFESIVELPYSFEKNGIYYKITGDNTVSVTYKGSNYNTYSGWVTIPTSVRNEDVTYRVTKVDNIAFYYCSNLTGVTIPKTVTTIGSSAFARCTALTSITIPNSVTTIGSYAFQYSTALSDVVIGSGVTSIGDAAFHGCEELEVGNITCKALVPPTLSSNTFDNDHYQGASLFVPRESYDDYAQAQYWENFCDIYDFWSLDDALNVAGGSIHFESTDIYAWTTIEDSNGRHYAQSGNKGVANSNSTLTAIVNVDQASTLSFEFKAWGEGSSPRILDKCVFAIDGEIQFTKGSYRNDWETYSVDLPAGIHTLKWRYSKNAVNNPTGDYFAVDNVAITSMQVKPGDVNRDGVVDINDALAVVNYILGIIPEKFDSDAADYNTDGEISIADAAGIVDFILSEE